MVVLKAAGTEWVPTSSQGAEFAVIGDMTNNDSVEFDPSRADMSEEFYLVTLLANRTQQEIASRLARSDARLLTIGQYKSTTKAELKTSMKVCHISQKDQDNFLKRLLESGLLKDQD